MKEVQRKYHRKFLLLVYWLFKRKAFQVLKFFLIVVGFFPCFVVVGFLLLLLLVGFFGVWFGFFPFTKALQRLQVLVVGFFIRQMLRIQFRKEQVCSAAEQDPSPADGPRKLYPQCSATSSGKLHVCNLPVIPKAASNCLRMSQ